MALGVLSIFEKPVLILLVLAVAGCFNGSNSEIVSAARSGQQKRVERLLFNGVDVNSRDAEGATPLIVSAEKGDISMVFYLVRRGADVNARKKNGLTALYLSAYHGYEKILQILLRNGADPGVASDEGYTPLMIAAERGRPGIAESLLLAGFKVNSTTSSGRTPLMFAAFSGNVETVRLLLKYGADPAIRSKEGETALDHALTGYTYARRKHRWDLIETGMPFGRIQEIIGYMPEPEDLYSSQRTVIELESGTFIFQYGNLVEWLRNKFSGLKPAREGKLRAFKNIIEILK